jgi:hypothetical protein
MSEARAQDDPATGLLQGALRRLQADGSLQERVRKLHAVFGAGALPSGERRPLDDLERALDGLL